MGFGGVAVRLLPRRTLVLDDGRALERPPAVAAAVATAAAAARGRLLPDVLLPRLHQLAQVVLVDVTRARRTRRGSGRRTGRGGVVFVVVIIVIVVRLRISVPLRSAD